MQQLKTPRSHLQHRRPRTGMWPRALLAQQAAKYVNSTGMRARGLQTTLGLASGSGMATESQPEAGAPQAAASVTSPQLDDDELQEQLDILRGTKQVSNNLYIATYLGISVAAGIGGFCVHAGLLKHTADLLSLKSTASGNFETSFFGLLSIVYGLFTGQTFLFLYERQVNIVQELYGEAFALELLIQRTFAACGDASLRSLMASCARRYIKEELYNPTDMESPFSLDSPYMGIAFQIEDMQAKGLSVKGLVGAIKMLADAQSRRSAVSAQILPPVHWVFMHAMEVIFVCNFLLFDAAELFGAGAAGSAADVPGERSLLFGALLALLTLTAQVLHDLEDPFEGMYSFKRALDDRLAFLVRKLIALETWPATYIPRSVRTFRNLGMIEGEDQERDRSMDMGAAADEIPRPAQGHGVRSRKRRKMLLPYMNAPVKGYQTHGKKSSSTFEPIASE